MARRDIVDSRFDDSKRAILLVGSHNWHNFQDNGHRLTGSDDPPPTFDTNSKFIPGKPVRGDGRRLFTTPFPGPAAVYLKRAGG